MNLFVVELALRISVLVAVPAIVTALMGRRASAASRHLVWTLAVVGVLLLPMGSLMLPAWRVPVHRTATLVRADPQPLSPVGLETTSDNTVPEFRPARVETDARALAAIGGLLPLAVYAIGVALLLVRLVGEHRKARRMVSRSTVVHDAQWVGLLQDCCARMNVGRPPLLLSSRDDIVPMACGVFKPVILLPSSTEAWDTDRRRAVLLHELAHVARIDCLTQTLAELAIALYWPHPGSWWTAHRLRVERELACDDRVLSCGAQPREYAGHLLEVAYSLGRNRAPALVVGMARPRQLEGRLIAVLDPNRKRTTFAARGRVLACVMAMAVIVPLATATIVTVPAEAAAQAGTTPAGSSRATIASPLPPGTWQLRRSADGRSVVMTVSESENSSHSATVSIDSFEGLAAALRGDGPGSSRFTLKRDAGTFEFEGVLRLGTGGGMVTFAPSATFPGGLVKRGFERPTATQQAVMAAGDVGFAFIDELAAQQYARPDLQHLVTAAQHGVGVGYVKEMADLGYRLGTVDALIRARDHGVSPQFVRDLRASGLDRLSADDLVRAHDHGVGPEFVSGLRTMGYTGLSLDELVTLHDHGISPLFVGDLRTLGYQLSLADFTRAHDHGIGPEYIKDLRTLGYTGLSLDDITNAHDHGISAGYVKDLAALDYSHLALNDLIRLHDHGVSAEWLRAFKSQNSGPASVDDLIRSRDGGRAGPERASSLHRELLRWDLRAAFNALLARLW